MVSYDVSIKDFLLTGQLGPIRLGLGQDFVRFILGQPDDERKFDYCPLPHFFQYYDLEITFSLSDSSSPADWEVYLIKLSKDVNSRILNQVSTPFCLPDVLKLDPSGVYFQMSLLKFCQALDVLNISYDLAIDEYGDDIFVLTPGGVNVYFDCSESGDCKENGSLMSFHSFASGRVAPMVPIEQRRF